MQKIITLIMVVVIAAAAMVKLSSSAWNEEMSFGKDAGADASSANDDWFWLFL